MITVAPVAAGGVETMLQGVAPKPTHGVSAASLLTDRDAVPVLTSREFNQDVARAKRAADDGPVVITDRGRPAYVLMRHETYRRLIGGGPGIRLLLSDPESEGVEFEPPRLGIESLKFDDLV